MDSFVLFPFSFGFVQGMAYVENEVPMFDTNNYLIYLTIDKYVS